MSEQRLYTVDEANGLLPALSASLASIRQARQIVLEGGERIRRTAGADGGGDVGKEVLEALSTLRREVVSITGQGIVLRDPERGLIDFPSRREGHEVFLCWRLGEERVAFWHGPDTGFAGRRPL